MRGVGEGDPEGQPTAHDREQDDQERQAEVAARPGPSRPVQGGGVDGDGGPAAHQGTQQHRAHDTGEERSSSAQHKSHGGIGPRQHGAPKQPRGQHPPSDRGTLTEG